MIKLSEHTCKTQDIDQHIWEDLHVQEVVKKSGDLKIKGYYKLEDLGYSGQGGRSSVEEILTVLGQLKHNDNSNIYYIKNR